MNMAYEAQTVVAAGSAPAAGRAASGGVRATAGAPRLLAVRAATVAGTRGGAAGLSGVAQAVMAERLARDIGELAVKAMQAGQVNNPEGHNQWTKEGEVGRHLVYHSPLRPVMSIANYLPKGFKLHGDVKDVMNHRTFSVPKPLTSQEVNQWQLEPDDPNHPVNLKKAYAKFHDEIMDKYADKGVLFLNIPDSDLIVSETIDDKKYPFRITRLSKDGTPSGHDVFKDFGEVTRYLFGYREGMVIQASSPKRGCLMAMVHGALENELAEWSKSNVPDAVLDPNEGRESETHVSILWGFDEDFDAARLMHMLRDRGEVSFTLGEMSRFDCPDYDVLKVDVSSPALEKLHRDIAVVFKDDIVPSENLYTPHLTIAYLKKGELLNLDGDRTFAGRKVTVEELLYSLPERKGRQTISLQKGEKRGFKKTDDAEHPSCMWHPEIQVANFSSYRGHANTVSAAEGAFAAGHKFWGNQWNEHAKDFVNDPAGEPSGKIRHAVLVIGGKRYKGPSHFQALQEFEKAGGVYSTKEMAPGSVADAEGFETESGHFLDREQAAQYVTIGHEFTRSGEKRFGHTTGKKWLAAQDIPLAAVDGSLYTQDAVQAEDLRETLGVGKSHKLSVGGAEPSPATNFEPMSERESTLANHRVIRSEAAHEYRKAVNRAIATLELQAVADLKRKETERVKKKRREEELDAIALLLFLAGERIYQSTSLKLASLLGQNATLTPLQAQPGTSLEGQPGATPTGEQAGTGGGGPLPAGTEEAEAFASIRQPLLVNFPRESAERLDQVTEEGRAAGKNDKEVARDLEEKAQEIEGGQGSVVAETEATATLGLAQLRLLQRAGFATCAWDQLDRPTKRETHFQNTLEGEVSVGHVFSNGQVCPGDASQGPGETVSCLCTLIGVKRKPGTGHLQASEPVKATAHDVNGLDWSYDYVQGSFEENKHPRGDKGTDKGGQFTSKGGGIGLKRFGEGKESKWVTHEGKDMPEHAKTLGIPPAWQNVRVAPGPEHDLQAIGHDKKGREQRIYSEAFTQRQAALKFSRNKELIEKQKDIFAQNEENLKSEHQDIVEQAACMKLIQATGIRPGSDTDTKGEKQAYGATTLEGRHVVEQDGKVRLVFVGKKGVSLDILVDDESVAAMLVERKKKSGNDGKLFNTDDAKLRNYSHTLDGGSFKPKDFRTLKGTITAMDEIKSDPHRSDSLKEFKKRVMAVAKKVADVLGNTPIIALQSYINPFVFESWKPVMQ